MSNLEITVEQFLEVREVLAEKLKESSTTQKPTRIKQAEELMKAGYVDIGAVLGVVEDRKILSYAEIEGGK